MKLRATSRVTLSSNAPSTVDAFKNKQIYRLGVTVNCSVITHVNILSISLLLVPAPFGINIGGFPPELYPEDTGAGNLFKFCCRASSALE